MLEVCRKKNTLPQRDDTTGRHLPPDLPHEIFPVRGNSRHRAASAAAATVVVVDYLNGRRLCGLSAQPRSGVISFLLPACETRDVECRGIGNGVAVCDSAFFHDLRSDAVSPVFVTATAAN